MSKGGTIDSIVEKEKGLKEISKAVSKQYENRPIELKKEPVYTEGKKIGTDGANEHDYAQEKGIEVDYSKLFEHMGVKKEQKYGEGGEAEKAQQVEERKGEMQPREIMEFVDDTFTEEMMRAGNRTNYEDKERFYRAIVFSENSVWFKYQESSSGFRHRNTNFSLNNMLN